MGNQDGAVYFEADLLFVLFQICSNCFVDVFNEISVIKLHFEFELLLLLPLNGRRLPKHVLQQHPSSQQYTSYCQHSFPNLTLDNVGHHNSHSASPTQCHNSVVFGMFLEV